MNILKVKQILLILPFLFSFNLLTVLTHAQPLVSSSSNTANAEAFCNRVIPVLLEKYKIPGTCVAFVQNGELVYKAGYGTYDSSRNNQVSPDSTLFRVGSITKLFTWTAVMQLVDQGKLDLDQDINLYLKSVKIPNTFDKPITLRHLMTHTAGFEDRLSGLFEDPDQPVYSKMPLEDYLKAMQPNRIFEPGEIIAYSNYGAALAGFIIEQVSGVKYEDYIKTNILMPLEMNHTFIFPNDKVPSLYRTDTSYGFKYNEGTYSAYEDALITLKPAGAVYSTAEDMAKFMLMHLNNGKYHDKTILSQTSAKAMHEQQYTSDKRLPGLCLGFMEWQRNGKRIIWHSGGTELFRALLLLIPDEETGIFISFNSPAAEKARTEFRQLFLDHYFPYDPVKHNPYPEFKERAHLFEGTFMEGRTALHNSDKLLFIASRYKKIRAQKGGSILFRDTRYIEIEPYYFEEVGGQGKLIFVHDKKGLVTRAFQDFEPHEAYIKVKWYQTLEVQGALFLICILLFFLPVIGWPVLKRWGRKTSWMHSSQPSLTFGIRLIQAVCLTNLLFLILITASITTTAIFEPRTLLSGNLPQLTKQALLIPFISAVINSAVLIYTFYLWKNKVQTLFFRVQYTLVAAAGIMFILWLKSYNLLGGYI